MTANELRDCRVQARIPGRLLCQKAGIARSRLCDIERSYVVPSEPELKRIEQVLRELIEARRKVEKIAAEVGWPI